jgi:RNA polymerase sigma-70 factor, ECF subfamily
MGRPPTASDLVLNAQSGSRGGHGALPGRKSFWETPLGRPVTIRLESGLDCCGNSREFLAEFHRYRSLLFSIAYRMLGAVADAEDMVQETFIRWQQASGEEVRSPKAFLVTIISRLCINQLESARARREEYVGEWLPEPVVTDPAADPLEIFRVDESLSIAFLTLLERLNPLERAVFLLHEVFEYEYGEIAAALERSEANCRQILKRAREHVREARPRLKAPNPGHDKLLEKFLEATRGGDLEGLMSLLSADVVLHTDGGGKGPALPHRVQGAERVARRFGRFTQAS